ncbi:MAG TPA: cation diffusion facilitator family transporter [Alphaproteobacteria bacterium]|nr:cation diffusion facilitator family transporter [Alphaproteobacteria bacterium]
MPGHDHHHHGAEGLGDRGLVLALAANGLLTAAQLVGGLLSGSLALVADALHNLNDAASLGLAYLARRIARRPSDKRRTFGYARAETIGALINLTTLILVGLYLVYEAVARLFAPEPVGGWTMVALGGVALVVDLATAALTWRMAKESLNIRAAFVHNVADAAGSVAVIVVGTLVILYGWVIADVIATLAIAGYVLHQGFTMIVQSIRVLMQSVPKDLDFDELVGAMRAVPGVRDVHHVHAWQLDEHHSALEAHIVIRPEGVGEMERIKSALKAHLEDVFGIGHSTLEFEFGDTAADTDCRDTAVVPRH